MLQSFAIALAAGMVATVNPCGFALLPAYLSAFIGLDDEKSRTDAIGRAVGVSAVLTAGFITVFGVFGILINSVIGGLRDYLPYATIVIGLILVGLGVFLLTGRELALNIPKLQRGGADGTLSSMYLFGVSYALASLSCTLGPFLATTSGAFATQSFAVGVGAFVLYGFGMGLVVGVLTVAVALAKDGIVRRFRQLLPLINRIAGGLMVIAGAYVAYYGWYEIQLFENGRIKDPVIDFALNIQRWLTNLLPNTDEVWSWVVGLVILLAAAYGARLFLRPDDPEPALTPDALTPDEGDREPSLP